MALTSATTFLNTTVRTCLSGYARAAYYLWSLKGRRGPAPKSRMIALQLCFQDPTFTYDRACGLSVPALLLTRIPKRTRLPVVSLKPTSNYDREDCGREGLGFRGVF